MTRLLCAAGLLACMGSLRAEEDIAVLWDESMPFPEVDTFPLLDAVTHTVVHRGEAGHYQFLLGTALAFHEGTLFASWGNSRVDENDEGCILAGRRSRNGGFTWSDFETIAPLDGEMAHSHGVFLSHEGALWAFAGRAAFGGALWAKVNGYPGLCTEAFVLDEATDRWESRGVVAGDGFWPTSEPMRLPNGSFIMGGLIPPEKMDDGSIGFAYGGVAVSHGGDLRQWDVVQIPIPDGLRLWGETALIVEGNDVTAIVRYGAKAVALVSVSHDGGYTWPPLAETNLPMAPVKPYAGMLSTGQRYLVCNFRDRNTLAVLVSRPGAREFCRVWRLRHGPSPAPRTVGNGKHPQWAYPYAVEHEGSLYVGYAATKEDCVLSIIPLTALAVD